MMPAPGPKESLINWLNYIESIHPASIELGLDRVKKVGEKLGLLSSWPCPIVTVAGTNGKGTTVKALSTLLHALDHTVATYTSPHLMDFTERLELNLKPALTSLWIDAFNKVEHARRALAESLTYFEFTSLSALYIIKQQPPEILILEIGLGGRLDAVNILDSSISIITNIGFDHMDFLGDTLDKIGEEKAGIVRENTPVILGRGAFRQRVVECIEEKKAHIYLRSRDFEDEEVYGEGQEVNRLFPESMQLAIQALKLLAPKLDISSEQIKALLRHCPNIELKGRFQRKIINETEWIIDVAHNTPAANWLIDNINSLPKAKVTHVVWCSFSDKNLEGIVSACLSKLTPEMHVKICWYMGQLNHVRSAKMHSLHSLNKQVFFGKARVFNTFEEALNRAYNQAKPNERVVAFGSFQAANEALAFIKKIEG